MKKTLKGLCTIAFAFILLFSLTGCGEEKTNSGDGNNNEGNQQQEQGGNNQNHEDEKQNNGVSDNLAWPDNVFTKQVPKPEQAFTKEAGADNSACYTYPNWTVAEAKTYVEKLKSNGYHVSSTMIDDDNDYLIYLKNDDESYQVTVASDAISDSLIISIPIDKR